MSKQGKILSLESIRGVAALCVALYHFPSFSPIYDNPFIKNGYLMVDLFFVLSGFVISLNYGDKISTFSEAAQFQLRRFWRLYPLHLFALFLFVMIEIAKLFGPQSTVQGAFSKNDFTSLFENLFLIHSISAEKLTFNFPSWSISAEFFAYGIFAIFCLIVRQFRLGFVIISFALLFVAAARLEAFDAVVGLPLLRCLVGFTAGMVVHLFWQKYPSFRASRVLALPLLIGSVAIVCQIDELFAGVPVLVFAMLVFSCASLSDDSYIGRVLAAKPLVWLGTVSYSIYMLHAFVWYVIIRVAQNLFATPYSSVPNVGVKLELSPLVGTGLTIFGIAILILLSKISFAMIEKPFSRGIGRVRIRVTNQAAASGRDR